MSEQHHHIVSPKTYFINLIVLMILMLLTIAAGRLEVFHFNPAINLIIALTIAFAKMMCIILIFMHVRWSSKLTWVFAGAGFFWFLIMIVITFTDYLTRGWHSPFTTPF